MKKAVVLLLITAVCAMFCSCSDSVEVRERNFVQAAGVSASGDNISISVRVFEDFDSTVVYTGKGKTFKEAVDDAEKYQGKDFYTGHMELLVADAGCSNEILSQIIDSNVSPSCLIIYDKDPVQFVSQNETTDVVNILHTAVRNKSSKEKTICDQINGR